MAEGRGELEVYNHWFAAADRDRDGVLGGAEAVQFFQLSGLPQNPTLFKASRAACFWLGLLVMSGLWPAASRGLLQRAVPLHRQAAAAAGSARSDSKCPAPGLPSIGS